MTTVEFPQERFLEYGRAVRAVLPENIRLVANVGDFDEVYARRLRDAGFTGVYHICRLGEGIDTGATVEARVRTMDAVKAAGLELYYCVEPIGPEHTNEQLAEEMQQTILNDNAYVFCSHLQMNMVAKATVTGLTAHPCDYYEITVDLDINET